MSDQILAGVLKGQGKAGKGCERSRKGGEGQWKGQGKAMNWSGMAVKRQCLTRNDPDHAVLAATPDLRATARNGSVLTTEAVETHKAKAVS